MSKDKIKYKQVALALGVAGLLSLQPLAYAASTTATSAAPVKNATQTATTTSSNQTAAVTAVNTAASGATTANAAKPATGIATNSKAVQQESLAKASPETKTAVSTASNNSVKAAAAPNVTNATSNTSILSDAFNYRKDLQASVDPRTGTFSMAQTDIDIPGVNGFDLSLGTRYEQNNMVDHFGLGMGWSYNFSYIDSSQEINGQAVTFLHLDDGEVYQLSGNNGDYTLVDYNGSGLKVTGDTSFKNQSNQTSYYCVSYVSGEKEYFDQSGDLIGMVNRFGNTIYLNYDNQNRLSSIYDNTYQQGLNFSYSGSPGNETITVTMPDNTNIQYVVANSQLKQKIDALGEITNFTYGTAVGESNFITGISYPTGAYTNITYNTQLNIMESGGRVSIPAVSELDNYPGTAGGQIQNPNQNQDYITTYNPQSDSQSHNYTGYPNAYNVINGTGDPIMLSDATASQNYTYQTTTTQDGYTTVSTYNHFHLLIEQQVSAVVNGVLQPIQDIQYWYPNNNSAGNTPTQYPGVYSATDTPANYDSPLKVVTTYYDPFMSTNPSRAETVTATYDPNGYGDVLTSIDAQTGTVTTNTYDYVHYNQPLSTATTFTAADSNNHQDENLAVKNNQVTASTKYVLTADSMNVADTMTYYTGSNGDQDENITYMTYYTDKTQFDFGMPLTKKIYTVDTTQGKIVGLTQTESYQYSLDTDNHTLTTTTIDTATQYDGSQKQYSTVDVTDIRNGNLLNETDANNNVTSYQYDNLGRVTQVTNPDGTVEKVYYAAAQATGEGAVGQNSTVMVFPNNYATRTLYDGFGREIESDDSVDGTPYQPSSPSAKAWRNLESKIYNQNDEVASSTDGNGNQTNYTYDNFGRLIATTFPNGASQYTIYNDAATNTSSWGVTYEVDASSNLITPYVLSVSQDYNGQAKTTDQYMITPDQISTANPISAPSFNQDRLMNALNGVVTSSSVVNNTNPNVIHTSSTYDGAGRTVSTTDGMGNPTYNYYNEIDQLLSVVEPSSVIASSGSGPVSTVTANELIAYAYDSFNNNIQVQASVCQGFDPTQGPASCTNSNPGAFPAQLLLNNTDSNIAGGSGYNELGELLEENFPNPNGGLLSNLYQYDGNGNLVWKQDTAGRQFKYDYSNMDKLQHVTVLKDPDTNDYPTPPTDGTPLISYTYYTPMPASGPPDQEIKSVSNWQQGGNTTTISYGYLLDGKLSSITYPDGKTMTYNNYDLNNNVLSMTDFGGNTSNYIYNNMNQLINVEDMTQYKDATGNLTNYNVGYVYNTNGTPACKIVYTGQASPPTGC